MYEKRFCLKIVGHFISLSVYFDMAIYFTFSIMVGWYNLHLSTNLSTTKYY